MISFSSFFLKLPDTLITTSGKIHMKSTILAGYAHTPDTLKFQPDTLKLTLDTLTRNAGYAHKCAGYAHETRRIRSLDAGYAQTVVAIDRAGYAHFNFFLFFEAPLQRNHHVSVCGAARYAHFGRPGKSRAGLARKNLKTGPARKTRPEKNYPGRPK